MSVFIRDQLIAQCWVSTSLLVPDIDPRGIHYPVQVLGVIDDSRFYKRMGGRFVDFVSYWPANKLWTVSFQSQACDDVVDLPVRVVCWQPGFLVPEDWP